MKKVAIALTNVIYKNNPSFSELDVKKIQFGLECFFSDSSKMLIYLILFSFFGLTKYYIIATIFFVTLRTVAGGYHEKTYIRCFISSFTLFLIMLYGGTMLEMQIYIKAFLALISLILICKYAPVDHPNKPIISEVRRKKLKIKSIIAYIIMLGISFFIGGKHGSTAFMALFVESISLPIGYYRNKL
jgi:accessory gene regulator B